MTYEFQDMTMAEMLRDPMIRQILRADGVSLSDFAVMLDDAARQTNKIQRNVNMAAIPAPHIIHHNACQARATQAL